MSRRLCVWSSQQPILGAHAASGDAQSDDLRSAYRGMGASRLILNRLSAGNAIGSNSVLTSNSAIQPIWGRREMTMIRKLLIGTASVLILGIGGAALDFS